MSCFQGDACSYGKPPIAQTLWQVRFPAVLQISSLPPAGFQARIRARFPLFSLSDNRRAYHFVADNREAHLSLDQQSLSVVFARYPGWEHVRDVIQSALGALIQEFAPPFLDRVGFRYTNVIRRSVYGVEHFAWRDLLRAGLVDTSIWEDGEAEVETTKTETCLRLSHALQHLRLVYGVVNSPAQPPEQAFLLDLDFLDQDRCGANRALEVTDEFHDKAIRLFRWCVAEQLHQAMEPAPSVCAAG